MRTVQLMALSGISYKEAILMQTQAAGKFTISGWNEQPYADEDSGDAVKMTQADVTMTFEGDIEGNGRVLYIMAYLSDKAASFVGMQRVVGRLGDKSGSFMLQTQGTYGENMAQATWSVVPGSGTGELVGLRGEGGYTAPEGGNVDWTLTYDFES